MQRAGPAVGPVHRLVQTSHWGLEGLHAAWRRTRGAKRRIGRRVPRVGQDERRVRGWERRHRSLLPQCSAHWNRVGADHHTHVLNKR